MSVRATKEITTIGIAFNLKRKKGDDHEEEYDEIETIEAVHHELRSCGFKVVRLEHTAGFISAVRRFRPEFILNLAEGIGGTRGRESQVPCILESLQIPYSGSDPIALGISLDKYLTHTVLKSEGIPVPAMHMACDRDEVASLKSLFDRQKYYVVKPRWEGSSKGVFNRSLVSDFAALRRQALGILKRYKQPVLVEEYLEREEVTVAACGNAAVDILGMMKIVPTDSACKMFIYSLENKRDWKKKIRYDPEDSLPVKQRRLLSSYAQRAYTALELRDIARIDFRFDGAGIPKIIDVNPLPGLSPHYSDLPIICRLKGISYTKLIRTILYHAFLRYGFKLPRQLQPDGVCLRGARDA